MSKHKPKHAPKQQVPKKPGAGKPAPGPVIVAASSAPMRAHLVLIETSGNQRYIFATNKLRENLGASEITWRVGTELVLEAVDSLRGEGATRLWDSEDPWSFTGRLTNQAANPRIEDGAAIEVIVATSGKALLLVRAEEMAREIVRRVTRRAAIEMPGVDVTGVISKPFTWNSDPIHAVVKAVHERHEEVRAARPGPESRFHRLPIVAGCTTTGLPAADVDWRNPEPGKERSASALAKREYVDKARKRLNRLLEKREYFARSLAAVIEQDALEGDWLAIVHADGNGLGEIFLRFDEISGCTRAQDNRDHVDKLRSFSMALEDCTKQAFLAALDGLPTLPASRGKRMVPVVPLVMGGDDLTVLLDGRCALAFTVTFLRAFEQLTKRKVRDIAGRVSPGNPRLGICAGVAVVKPHFPFFTAYSLAEELVRSAKQVKTKCQGPCSALDVHIHHDASGADLDRIRSNLAVDGGSTRLYARPFIVSDKVKLGARDTWRKPRYWEDLVARARTLRAPSEAGDGRQKLPNSQLHELRQGLFLGHEEADGRLRNIYGRYEALGLKDLVLRRQGAEDETSPTLFFDETDETDNQAVRATMFLDTMEVANFLEGAT